MMAKRPPSADQPTLLVEPALGENEQALRQEDHHQDEDDAYRDQVGEGRDLRQVVGGGEPREKARETLAQGKEKPGAQDRADERADATHDIEDHHLARNDEVDEVGRGE